MSSAAPDSAAASHPEHDPSANPSAEDVHYVNAEADSASIDQPTGTNDPTSLKVGTSLRVIKAYHKTDENELELEVDDVVDLDEVPASNDEFWWKGTNRSWGPNNGCQGYFPSSCVVVELWELDPDNPPPLADDKVFAPGVTTDAPTDVPDESSEVLDDGPPAPPVPEPVPPGTKVLVREAFQASMADELDLRKGEEVVVLEAPDGGWWRGMSNLGSKEAKTGWFPATMITVPADDGLSPAKSAEASSSSIGELASNASSPTKKAWFKRLISKKGKDGETEQERKERKEREKQAEKEKERQKKAEKEREKEREKAEKEREKTEREREKAEKEREKIERQRLKEAEKQRLKAEKRDKKARNRSKSAPNTNLQLRDDRGVGNNQLGVVYESNELASSASLHIKSLSEQKSSSNLKPR
ncbi:uncharacterized protein BJ171DRAFT_619703 [Polychytrium aggregatum]|uniref:uncharacterized protein n=1 Tax=Polychytrium aggregatum TaxID=110093 RepID=UPI0022FE5F78|nr:uncharacterized protein BJ171DRAFT_619703 [Polychytrium aggregatum]KAI9204468.1 hypothetical protein BJ171DRAFT_619703 [Polychytrium aggregatum]